MDERRLDIGDLISAGITSQPVPKGGGMSDMIDQVRETIREEIAEGWPGAVLRADRGGGDDHRDDHSFKIRADGEDYWIILGHHAIRQDDAEEVVGLLRRDAQEWIDQLQEKHCVFIGMADNYPVLRFCPD